MADDGSGTSTGSSPTAVEDAALQKALAAAHTAVWGYGVVGAALPLTARDPAVAAERAHRDLRDRLAGLVTSPGDAPVAAGAAVPPPLPVLSALDPPPQ